jgi:undecaprenyl-diphosphatase
MNIWQALVLGLVQGLTEFLPISSSGHLALVQQWFAISEPTLLFDVFLHAASLVAIVIFFWPEIMKLRVRDYWLLGLGTVPAVIIGLLLEDSLETFWSAPLILGATFIVTGLINVWIHRLLQHPPKQSLELNENKALTIGLFQAFAIIPAISRSGSTLLGGLWAKMDKEKAFEFTFLLGIPAILGANLLQIYRLVGGSAEQGFATPVFFIGGLASLIASLWSLKLLKQFLVQSRFVVFGWYCLLLGGAIMLYQLIR